MRAQAVPPGGFPEDMIPDFDHLSAQSMHCQGYSGIEAMRRVAHEDRDSAMKALTNALGPPLEDVEEAIEVSRHLGRWHVLWEFESEHCLQALLAIATP